MRNMKKKHAQHENNSITSDEKKKIKNSNNFL